MTELVRYEVADGVATLIMDSPPLNMLGHGLRSALARAIDRAAADPEVRAVVLGAAGRSWPVGADIREFGARPEPPDLPDLPEVCARLAEADKPVIAAIHGTALGGGLELALVAALRVATRDTMLGLPEVTLGLVPGAGGTQRLPRLIGAQAALDLMLTGAPVSAERALALGLIDKVAPGDVLATAGALARAHAEGRATLPPARRRKLSGVADAAAYLAGVAKARAAPRPDHDHARRRIVDCVEAALLLPADEGFVAERTAFEDLMATPEARALRHAFFAERRAARSLPRAFPPDLKHIAILGGGAIGAGLAGELIARGMQVTLVDPNGEALSLALTRIARAQDVALARNQITKDERLSNWGFLKSGGEAETALSADLVIDCLPEDPAAKAAALSALAEGAQPVLSVTCALDPIALAAALPGRHTSLYLTEPVRRVTVAEVAAPEDGDAAVAAASALARLMGWRLLRPGPVAGFIGQRLWTTRKDAADRCLAAGAAPHEVDRALRAWGMALGPYELCDVYGPDHALLKHSVRREGLWADPLALGLEEWMVAEGRTGRRGGRGYHLYDPTHRHSQGDPAVIAALDRQRAPAEMTPADLQRRMLAALANDGAWMLAEGRARNASDIDLVAMGQGFPRWRGGPMQAADEAGLLALRKDLRIWAEAGDPFWQPAPVWDELIKNGRRFADLNGD